MSLATVSYPWFHEPEKGLSFILLEPEVFNALDSPYVDSHVLMDLKNGGILSLKPCESQGFLVSQWIANKLSHPGRVLICLIYLTILCVSDGFGSRSRASSFGTNLYFGPHLSNMSHPSPVEGKGMAQVSEYFRQQFKHFQYFGLLHTALI